MADDPILLLRDLWRTLLIAETTGTETELRFVWPAPSTREPGEIYTAF